MPSVILSRPLTIDFDLEAMVPRPLDVAGWSKIIGQVAPLIKEATIIASTTSSREILLGLLGLLDRAGIDVFLHLSGPWIGMETLLRELDAFTRLIDITLPLHGTDAATHALISPGEDFAALQEAIRLAVLWNHQIRLKAVLGRHNLIQLEQMAGLAESLGAAGLTFTRYQGSEDRKIFLSREETDEALTRIEALIQEGWAVAADSSFPPCAHPSLSRGCGCGNTIGTIDSSGRLRACPHADEPVGDLTRQSITTIWDSRAFRRWRADIPNNCKECRFFLSFECFGGCRCAARRHGTPADPLMVAEFTHQPPALEQEVNLDEDLCPLPRFTSREEPFGLALIREGSFLPVRKGARRLLEALNGKASLRELCQNFGSDSLPFIFGLYLKGLVTFHYSETGGGMLPDPRTPPPRIVDRADDDDPVLPEEDPQAGAR